jgi:metal-responsive CopG/Arc/MetJ family transcriptional regulator
MERTITINLAEETASELAAATREEGLSAGEIVRKAIDDYLYARKFRRLRERMMSDLPESYTDQDIFDRVS